MLKHRLSLGPLLILLLILIVWLDEVARSKLEAPGLVFGAAVLLMGLAAARELTAIFRTQGVRVSTPVIAIAISLGILLTSLTPLELREQSGVAVVASVGILIMFGSMLFYSRNQTTSGVIASVSTTVLSFVYVGLAGGFLIVLMKEYGGWVLLGVVLTTKSCDIGAYFTGSWIGRHKLVPWLSPGKTWEGLLGGMATAALVGGGLALLTAGQTTPIALAWWQGAIIGAAFGLVGQMGDLVASMLKRDAGVKDYSQALPGFGGVMDIADSLLLVAPVAYWVLLLAET